MKSRNFKRERLVISDRKCLTDDVNERSLDLNSRAAMTVSSLT